MFNFLKKSVDTESVLVSRIWGRLVDLIHAHALDPSARTTFENFATNQLTPYSAS